MSFSWLLSTWKSINAHLFFWSNVACLQSFAQIACNVREKGYKWMAQTGPWKQFSLHNPTHQQLLSNWSIRHTAKLSKILPLIRYQSFIFGSSPLLTRKSQLLPVSCSLWVIRTRRLNLYFKVRNEPACDISFSARKPFLLVFYFNYYVKITRYTLHSCVGFSSMTNLKNHQS